MKKLYSATIIILTLSLLNGCLDSTSTDAGTPEKDPPAKPEVSSIDSGNGLLTVKWNAVEGAENYTVYFGTTSGLTKESASSTGITSTQFNQSSLTNGTTYYYRIAALDSEGNVSELSDEISGTPFLDKLVAPLEVDVKGADGIVYLNWSKSAGATNYIVYWDTASGVTEASNKIEDVTKLEFSHEKLSNESEYYYRVAASGEGVENSE